MGMERLGKPDGIWQSCGKGILVVSKSPHLPGFGLPKMQVVDAVKIHVLCMPSKSCLPHPEVEVGSVHTLYDDATLVLHHVQEGVQIANVPFIHILEPNRNGLYWEMAEQPQPTAPSQCLAVCR